MWPHNPQGNLRNQGNIKGMEEEVISSVSELGSRLCRGDDHRQLVLGWRTFPARGSVTDERVGNWELVGGPLHL